MYSVCFQIPKGFSYFAVDFGLQPGFAHVIENETLFPANFARVSRLCQHFRQVHSSIETYRFEEVIGGVLDLHHNLWRKPQRESFEEQLKKMQKLKELWKPYDWTEKVKAAMRQRSD